MLLTIRYLENFLHLYKKGKFWQHGRKFSLIHRNRKFIIFTCIDCNRLFINILSMSF